jgi:hypothetical protein
MEVDLISETIVYLIIPAVEIHIYATATLLLHNIQRSSIQSILSIVIDIDHEIARRPT